MLTDASVTYHFISTLKGERITRMFCHWREVTGAGEITLIENIILYGPDENSFSWETISTRLGG